MDKVKESTEEVIIRPVTQNDIPTIRSIAVEGFGEDVAFKLEHYESQLSIFPEGQQCAEYNGTIIGASGSLIVTRDQFEKDHTLDDICNKGYIYNHNPEANHLYGIEVVVQSKYRHMKVGKQLYQARKDLCQQLQLESIVIGGRIPFYHKYAHQYSPSEYVDNVMKRKIYDPVMTFQLNNGFTFHRIMRGYLPEDKESCTNATLMEWKAPND
ncbi:GNAT family N-acetyltransferase [Salicibibacter cibarius]|uniref:GNAT family N-acetyltransferase n=1 Tax=Salicibibacter cibarius TaxID=2743000 RepID=A0A7T7CBF7_9BACI|nr:GNAT family N-acetyltransferase [Salicibibacter cibarius]QQK75769.1 GNAT family N-acetyltransferase [Salicibibacter cibarius]